MKLRIFLSLSILSLLLPSLCLTAEERQKTDRRQKDTTKYSNEFLDTVQVVKAFSLNDYSMIGLELGAVGTGAIFTPSRKQDPMIFFPQYFGVYFTKYGRLFNLPYVGFETGLYMGKEGYRFKKDDEGNIATLEGATQAVMNFIELPFMAQLHFDKPHFKIYVNVGIYGGYRLNIQRSNTIDESFVPEEKRFSFLATDNRWDYGLKGGLGTALVFDPVEINLRAMVRYSWSSLYQPNYYSEYYYRFAYPFDVMVSAGVSFHLGKRSGKNRQALRREAYEKVYIPAPSDEKEEN